MTHAIARAATELDQGLMLVLDTGEPGRTVQHILRDGLIDGVLVSAVAAGETWVEQLLSADLPAVLIGSHPTRTDVDVVDVENLESSARVVEHLIEQGCRRIATITGPLDRVDATQRLNGFRLAHERHGLAVDEDARRPRRVQPGVGRGGRRSAAGDGSPTACSQPTTRWRSARCGCCRPPACGSRPTSPSPVSTARPAPTRSSRH